MSTQSALWRKWRAQLSSRPTIPRLTAACTPTPKAAPCRLSTAAPTPARSRRQKSHPPGRRCAWRPAREPSVLKWKNKKRKKNRCGRGSRAQRRARGETAFKALEAHRPLLPSCQRPPRPPSSSSLLRLWVGSHWRLVAIKSHNSRHNRLSPASLHPRERGCKQGERQLLQST